MQLTTFRSFNTKDKLYTRYIYIFGYMLLCHLHTVLSRKMHLLLSTENEFWLWHLSFKYFRKLYYVSKLPASLSTQSWWGMRNPNYNSHDIIFDKNVHCCRRGNCSQPTEKPSHWLLKVLMLSLVNTIIGFQVIFSLEGSSGVRSIIMQLFSTQVLNMTMLRSMMDPSRSGTMAPPSQGPSPAPALAWSSGSTPVFIILQLDSLP